MSQVITSPPDKAFQPDGSKPGGWWHTIEGDDRIACDLCPRDCRLKPGNRGFCFVRENRGGEMVLTTYGRSTGFCIDPIEKKPLNHFYPGTSILSFGTAGCNLGCKFCQNWDISKSREVERLSELATPEAIAKAAQELGCHSVAFTYNDPVIWAEYAIDVAAACHDVGIKTVAVTAGYITPAAREPFFNAMDAANVDLKAFTEDFYFKLTQSHIEPVLESLKWLKHESDVWFEITNLIIPEANDTEDEVRQMCDWILEHLGDDVPVHFTAFHPDFRMQDRPRTPHETLLMARKAALSSGIKHAYTGNVNDLEHQSTYCPHCHALLIERNWYELGTYHLDGDKCGHCGALVAGRFMDQPGTWGRRRLPVKISQYADSQDAPPQQLVSSQRREAVMPATAEPKVDPVKCPELTTEQQDAIFRFACEQITAQVCGHPLQPADATLAGASREVVMGAFVTAKRKGRLRGCCGVLGQPYTILNAVAASAKRTAIEDMRLPPISPSELPFLDIDVTLLFGFQEMESKGEDRIKEVEIGKHGLQIQRGNASGLLLPSVPVENNWDAEEFLKQVCRKARLPVTAWKDDNARLRKFEGLMFGAGYHPETLPAEGLSTHFVSPDEVKRLLAFMGSNLMAISTGATPNYYSPGASDGTVNGIAITMRSGENDDSQHIAQTSLRPGFALQSTLFNLTQSAARGLHGAAARGFQGDVNFGLTVLADPAMHGTLAEPDLDGFDPKTRALMLIERNKTVWIYRPESTTDELLSAAREQAKVISPEATQLFSLVARSTVADITVSNVPQAQTGSTDRPAAVAGSFYPADEGELNSMVDSMLGSKPWKLQSWPAVMVPHAGLKYSGQIAADVFRRIKIPETVIVIGPKHTRMGVQWAVAPNEAWSIPGATIQSDVELAKQLAEELPGFELDAGAHRNEHAIEVELPFLAKLAPQTKVVGIAIGGGNFETCQEIATGLAKVMRAQRKKPLLVISSDMNHFATDEENRRLDEMAMKALDTLDPKNIYDTVTNNNISMCGMLPAVIVLETLKQMRKLKKSTRVGYATTADVTGDKSRVVGYSGMLFG